MLEDTVQYGEIKWKKNIIQAWTETAFFLNSMLVKMIVVNQWYDTINYSTYILESSGGTTFDPNPLSQLAVKGLREGITSFTPSNNPIVTLKFGSTGNSLTDSIFDGVFPLQLYTGKESELIDIPGVGDVLPATWIDIRESMVIASPTP
jgi:hypothetical protein